MSTQPLMGSDNENMGVDGLPAMTSAEKDAAYASAQKMLTIMPIATTAIGFGIAYSVFSLGDTASYTARIADVTAKQGHWAFLSGFVFQRLVGFLNMFPIIYKQQAMRAKSGNLRANPIIYEQTGQGAATNKVIMVEAGDVGRMNRANRSLHHFVESSLGVAAGIVLASSVFPLPVFICTCVFALGRVLHQVGYSSPKGYGQHGMGFGISTLSSETIAGFMLLVGLKGLGLL